MLKLLVKKTLGLNNEWLRETQEVKKRLRYVFLFPCGCGPNAYHDYKLCRTISCLWPFVEQLETWWMVVCRGESYVNKKVKLSPDWTGYVHPSDFPLCPRSWPLLQSTDLHTFSAWSCKELDSWTGKEIIAIDQREEVRRPQDKLLCCWMTSISSRVTWNYEWCWGGTKGRMGIDGGLLSLSGPNRVTVCTWTHPFQRILSEEQGDELLRVRRWGILSLRPVDLICKHNARNQFELKNIPTNKKPMKLNCYYFSKLWFWSWTSGFAQEIHRCVSE